MPDLIQQIGNSNPDTVAQAAFTMLNTLQDISPQDRIMASSVLFLLFCERNDIKPSVILDYTTRLVYSKDYNRKPQFKALDAYVRNEF